MFKTILTAVATAAVAFAVSAPAQATSYTNGLVLNGFSKNGLALNGLALNGFSKNGLALNGLALNGFSRNGLVLNGLVLNGFMKNGLVLNGRSWQGTSTGASSLQIDGIELPAALR